MSTSLLLLRAAIFAALSLTTLSAQAYIERETGLARDLSSDLPLYREEHLLRRTGDVPGERLVIYRCTNGTAFARKTVRYAGARVAPQFELIDARSGYRESATCSNTGLLISVTDSANRTSQGAVASNQALVADAGFDEWVRAQWQALTSGKKLEMQFLVPSRLRTYGFAVSSAEARTPNERAFRLRLGGLLGLFAPSIDVAYDAQTRRLLRFEGLSNIRDDSGDAPLKVRIDFPMPPQEVDEAAWQSAASEPLRACSVSA